MSSTGQIVGGIVGGVIGAFAGVPMLGASIGMGIGGAIDPPKGPKIEGPRLNDLSVQTATYGAVIPRVYGIIATFGNIFWVENNAIKESSKTEGGGKGGSSPESTTYSYSATFALGLCQGPIQGVRRIWASGRLIYDAGSNDVGTIIASNEAMGGIMGYGLGGEIFTIYLGGADQMPDDRMQAALGADTSAYRGLAYIVFKDFQLANYGNSLMSLQLKVEVINQPVVHDWLEVQHYNDLDVGFCPYLPSHPVPNLVGTAYLVSSAGGILTVGLYGSTTGYQINVTDGSFIGTQTLDLQPIENPVSSYATYAQTWAPLGNLLIDERVRTYQVKRNSAHDAAGYGSSVIGYGAVVPYLGDYRFVGTFIDGPLIAWRIAHGQSAVYWATQTVISNTEDSIFVLTSDDFWYLIDPDGVVLDAGTVTNHQTVEITSRSFGLYAVAFDSINRTYTMVGGGNVFVFQISASKALAQVNYFGSLPYTGGNFWGKSIYIDNGLIYLVSGVYLEILAFVQITPTPITLGQIVSAECLSAGLLDAGDIDVTSLTQIVRGYRVSSLASIRSAIEPLQVVWPFDVVQDGYQIGFVLRGQTSVATIDISELGAVAGNDTPGIRITHSREMDSQLPRKVGCTYIDVNREYDMGAGPGAERLNTDAINLRQIELPIVLNATECAGVEETLLYLAWLERDDISLILPPTYINLQAADVITVNGDSAVYSLRLTDVTYLPDGRLEVAAKYNSAGIYSPSAVGEESLSLGQVLTLAGPAEVALLDIPCVDAVYMNQPGITTAMTGALADWPGGTLFRSDDGGQTWPPIQGFAPPGAIVGVCSTALGVGTTHVVDTKGTLTVRLRKGTLSSVSDATMFSGGNAFAYGAHGRWEIISAKNCVLQASGEYLLSDFMRGRFGTEWTMTTHMAGDKLVLLDASALRFVGMNMAFINMPRLWRGITQGKTLDSASTIDFTYTGVNLKCLSPIALRGSRSPTTLAWTLEWTRRSRLPVEPFSGVPTPLGESSEIYEVEIWDATYSTLKRTLPGLTSPTAAYLQADQITDFSVEQSTVYFKVRQISATVERGFPAQASVYHYLPLDPFGVSVSLLMHMDGADNGTVFTDQIGNAVSVFGNTCTKTGVKKYGSASAYFDGAGDSLTVASAASISGTGDFTVEGWLNPTAFGSGYKVWLATDTSGGFSSAINSNGTITFGRSLVATDGTSANSVTFGAQNHVAICRASGTLRIFINGTVGLTQANSTSFISGVVRIGTDGGGSALPYTGYIDELRFTSAARYTSDFTPPTSAFPNP